MSPLLLLWALLGLVTGAAVAYTAIGLRYRALSWQAAAAEAERVLETVNACASCSTSWVEHWPEIPGVPRAGKLLRVDACREQQNETGDHVHHGRRLVEQTHPVGHDGHDKATDDRVDRATLAAE